MLYCIVYAAGYDPVGWGLPYGNLVTQDTAKPLMESAIQVLVILLDYGHPIQPPLDLTTSSSSSLDAIQASGIPYVNPANVETKGFNIFRKLMSSIEAPDQLHFIFRGFARLFNNVLESENTYLPNSITRINIEQVIGVVRCMHYFMLFCALILLFIFGRCAAAFLYGRS